MRVLLFGGTFDPPHNGHLNNLKAAVQAVQPDEVVVMPAGVPPHKKASSTPAGLRYAMCGCFEELFRLPSSPRFTLSDWEIRRAEQGYRNYSVDTLKMLGQTRPGAELYMTVGSDMLLDFTKWHDGQTILKLCVLVVQSRQSGDDRLLTEQAEQLQAQGARILFAHAPALPLASRDIRSGAVSLEQLPEPVRRLVQENHLYGYGR